MMRHFKVNTPRWFIIDRNENDHKLLNQNKEIFRLSVRIQPNDQGSTIGLTICRGEVEVTPAIEKALKFSDRVLVEDIFPAAS